MGRNKFDKFLIGPFFLDGKLTGTKYVDFYEVTKHPVCRERKMERF